MLVDNGFSRTIDLLHRAMDASAVRQSVIANNFANSGVPNFKRSDVNFESALKRALEAESKDPGLQMTLTNNKHIAAFKPRDYRDVEIRRVLDYTSTANNNGNNVNPEEEVNLALENQMRYSVLTSATAFEFAQVNSVLRG